LRLVRMSSVEVPVVLGENRLQVPFAEDQYPVGNPDPGGEDEPFGLRVREDCGAGRIFAAVMSVLARAASRESVNCPARVADQEPEVRGPITEVDDEQGAGPQLAVAI
jgi:hypothetical protein